MSSFAFGPYTSRNLRSTDRKSNSDVFNKFNDSQSRITNRNNYASEVGTDIRMGNLLTANITKYPTDEKSLDSIAKEYDDANEFINKPRDDGMQNAYLS